MKRLALFVAMIMTLPALAQAASYQNKGLKFRMNYDSNTWSKHEMNVMPSAGKMVGGAAAQAADRPIEFSKQGAIDWGKNIGKSAGEAAVGYGAATAMMKSAMSGMPKFASVTFTNKSHPDSQIMLTIVESSGPGPAGMGGATAGQGSGSSGCTVLKNESLSWGGRSALHMVMRCPQGEQWQYTETATMKKGGIAYNMMGFTTLESADDALFEQYVGTAFKHMIANSSIQ